MPVDLETVEWMNQADEARKANVDLAARLEQVKEEAQDQREHAHRALDANAKLQRMMQESNQALEVVVLERDDLRERLAKAGARLSTVESELTKAQVEAEARTKKTARKVVEEVVEEALAAAAVAEDWFNGLTPDNFILLMKELQDRMDARIHAIDDFAVGEPF